MFENVIFRIPAACPRGEWVKYKLVFTLVQEYGVSCTGSEMSFCSKIPDRWWEFQQNDDICLSVCGIFMTHEAETPWDCILT